MSQTTAREVSALLARDAERVARHLLGDGKREGQELRYGDAYGSKGKPPKIPPGATMVYTVRIVDATAAEPQAKKP